MPVTKSNFATKSDEGPGVVNCIVNADTGTFHLIGEINENALFLVHKALMSMMANSKTERIKFMLTTPGGDLYSAFGIYDLIKACQRPVDIVAVAYCMSAGTLIQQAGAQRFATPNTHLMVHFGSELHTSVNVQKHLAELNATYIQMLIARTGKTKKVVSKWISNETYFNATEAKEAGLIDAIVEA